MKKEYLGLALRFTILYILIFVSWLPAMGKSKTPTVKQDTLIQLETLERGIKIKEGVCGVDNVLALELSRSYVFRGGDLSLIKQQDEKWINCLSELSTLKITYNRKKREYLYAQAKQENRLKEFLDAEKKARKEEIKRSISADAYAGIGYKPNLRGLQ